MRRRQDEAYVLGTRELGEADLIVTLLASEHGRVRGVARSARRSRRRFGGCLEPLTRVQAAWAERDGRELHRIESLESRRSYAAMQADPLRQATCAVIAEVTADLAQEEHAEPDTFRLVGALLDALEAGGPPWALLRYFEFWVLRFHGMLGALDACSSCGGELGDAAAVVPGAGLACDDCRPEDAEAVRRLGPAGREFLGRVRREPPGRLSEPGSAVRADVALDRLLRGSLEAYAEKCFRSYRHFRSAEAFEAPGGRA